MTWRKNLLFILFGFLLALAMGCKDKEDPYYVVNKVRAPLVQFYDSGILSTQGCAYSPSINPATSGNTHVWCQQFPLRYLDDSISPSPTHYGLKFLVVAPLGEVPSVTLTSLSIFDLNLLGDAAGGGARGVSPSTPRVDIPLSDFGLNVSGTLTTVSSSGMGIYEVVFPMSSISFAQYLAYANQISALPGFILNYKVTATGDSYVDEGFMTFYTLPASLSDARWSILAHLSFVQRISQAQELSTQITPIQILGFSPASGAGISAQSNNSFCSEFTSNPLSPYASGQWYVSSGEIDNSQAACTSWNPKKSGDVSAVFVLRDLIGGSDFYSARYSSN
jgi:hypothetical protein